MTYRSLLIKRLSLLTFSNVDLLNFLFCAHFAGKPNGQSQQQGQQQNEMMENFFKTITEATKTGGKGGGGGGGDKDSMRLFMTGALVVGGFIALYYVYSGSSAHEITWKEFVNDYLNSAQVKYFGDINPLNPGQYKRISAADLRLPVIHSSVSISVSIRFVDRIHFG